MNEEEILLEFSLADQTQQHILIMAHFGRAIYYSQLLEQQCVNMLAIEELSKLEDFKEEDVDRIWDKYDFSKQTLGSFKNSIVRLFKISDEDVELFNKFLKLRNHYTHSYFRYNDVLFNSISGKTRMVRDFFGFTILAKELDNKLANYIEKYNVANNFTDDKIDAMVEVVRKEWSSKIIDENFDTEIKNN